MDSRLAVAAGRCPRRQEPGAFLDTADGRDLVAGLIAQMQRGLRSSDEAVPWRIAADTPTYEAHDKSGGGAELSGGRCNRKGTPLVYASRSGALACLETVVRLTQTPLPLNRYLVEPRVPRAAREGVARFNAAQAVGWDAEPARKVSLDWGTGWAKEAMTLLALVPSVVVEEEFNILINPRHPDFSYDRPRGGAVKLPVRDACCCRGTAD